MKTFKRVLLLVILILAGIIILNYPKLNIISGFASKNMASSQFISGRTAVSVTKNDHNVPMIKHADVTAGDKEATATVYGLMERKSICSPGLGCVLINDEFNVESFNFSPDRTLYQNDSLPFPYGTNGIKDTIFPNVDYDQIKKAIDGAFANPEQQKTRTVLVVYKGQVLGEQYLEGFTHNTAILGWSMTKSVLATLYGILEHQGKIDLNAPAPIDSWQDDERKDITLNHLLRMQSGLAWEEDYSNISDITEMLFLDADMTAKQERKEAIAKPTEIWNYSSGTSNLLSGILRDQFKTHQEYLDFPYSALIDKIGMSSMLIEADMSGNYVGSSYGWANTRDWAKFGILYLNNGNWNGEQLFDSSWVDYIS